MRPFLACLLALPALAANPSPVSVAPVSLTFTQQTGMTGSAVQGFFLTGPQGGSYTISRSPSAGWLQIVSSSGNSALGGTLPDFVQVGVTTPNIGTYNTTIGFVTPAGTLPVNVTLNVTGSPVLVANPGIIYFNYTGISSSVPVTNSVQVFLTINVPALISATSTTPWLTAKASGSIVQVTADPTKVPGDIAAGTVEVRVANVKVGNDPLVVPVVFLRNGLFSQGPNVTRIVNGATWADAQGISPGEIVTIGGTALGPATPAGLTVNQDGTVATTVAGTQVLFNGVAGPIVYTSQNVVSAVAPYEVAGSSNVSVQVVNNGVGSNAPSLPAAASVPGIFAANAQGSGPGAILNQDYSVNSPSNPAAPGSAVSIYATGEGQTAPPGKTGSVTSRGSNTPGPAQQVTATVGGQPADCGICRGSARARLRGAPGKRADSPKRAPGRFAGGHFGGRRGQPKRSNRLRQVRIHVSTPAYVIPLWVNFV